MKPFSVVARLQKSTILCALVENRILQRAVSRLAGDQTFALILMGNNF